MKNSGEKVTCETPTPGKKPTRIDKWKYDAIRSAILKALPVSGEGVLFKELPALVSDKLDDETRKEIGSISWYTTTVKLDLECRQEVERIKGSSPQRLLRSEGGA